MFGMFKKKQKSDLEKLIEKDGIEYAAKRFSEIILQKIPTEEIAYQFVLEEIEAASQGNDTAIRFARNSGISPQEYKGSMRNSRPEVDGPDGPQQFILALCMQLQPNVDLVVDLRTKIVDNIMKTFSIGKYEGQKSSSPIRENYEEELTSPFEPKAELQSEEGLRNYFSRLSSLERSKLFVEFSNVRAAKRNLMSMPTGLNDFFETQTLVTDLTDKSVAICMFVFGQPAVLSYNDGDLRSFNGLVNEIDDEVANLDLEPERHGEQLLKRIGEHLHS